MLNRGIPAAYGNLFQGQAGVCQKMTGTVSAEFKNIGLYGYPFKFFENAVQICAIQTDMLGNILNSNFNRVAAVDICDYLLHKKFFSRDKRIGIIICNEHRTQVIKLAYSKIIGRKQAWICVGKRIDKLCRLFNSIVMDYRRVFFNAA